MEFLFRSFTYLSLGLFGFLLLRYKNSVYSVYMCYLIRELGIFFSSVWVVFSVYWYCPWLQKVFILQKSSLFFSLIPCFVSYIKSYITHGHADLNLCFLLRVFVVLPFKYWCMILFELIFYLVLGRVKFLLFHEYVQWSQYHVLKNCSFSI